MSNVVASFLSGILTSNFLLQLLWMGRPSPPSPPYQPSAFTSIQTFTSDNFYHKMERGERSFSIQFFPVCLEMLELWHCDPSISIIWYQSISALQHILYLVIAECWWFQLTIYIFTFCKNLEKNPEQFCARQLVGVEVVRPRVNILSYDSVRASSELLQI